MKKMLLFIAAVAILAACSKKEDSNEVEPDRFNGYDQFHKDSDLTKNLRIRGDVIGTVKYSFNMDDATFEVEYVTDEGWELIRTHMFAGKWMDKPLNKRNDRKRFRFPQKTTHDPYVNTYTYSILLEDLPHWDEPGFIVAAHAKLYNTSTGKYRHAWADWDTRFRCSGWGGYSEYYYNPDAEDITNYYSVAYELLDDGSDGLNVYLVNASDNEFSIFHSETGVGTPPNESDNGVAIDSDPDIGYIYFTDYNTNELYVNILDEIETPAYSLGTLNGIPSTAAFSNETFYYINPITDPQEGEATDYEIRAVTINKVNGDGKLYFISTDDVPKKIITDDNITAIGNIAVESNGNLFLIAENSIGDTQLLKYDPVVNALTSTDIININDEPLSFLTNPQIAFSENGEEEDLYMVYGSVDDGGGIISTLSPESGLIQYTIEDGLTQVCPECELLGQLEF